MYCIPVAPSDTTPTTPLVSCRIGIAEVSSWHSTTCSTLARPLFVRPMYNALTFRWMRSRRSVCHMCEEVIDNGGVPFDAVVICAGMFDRYSAEKIYRLGAANNLGVLVLDGGPSLVAMRVQNLPMVVINALGLFTRRTTLGCARTPLGHTVTM